MILRNSYGMSLYKELWLLLHPLVISNKLLSFKTKRQNIDLASRKQKLIEICNEILAEDETTKIIVFADGRIGGGISAREALNSEDGLGCTWLDENDT